MFGNLFNQKRRRKDVKIPNLSDHNSAQRRQLLIEAGIPEDQISQAQQAADHINGNRRLERQAILAFLQRENRYKRFNSWWEDRILDKETGINESVKPKYRLAVSTYVYYELRDRYLEFWYQNAIELGNSSPNASRTKQEQKTGRSASSTSSNKLRSNQAISTQTTIIAPIITDQI